jgi:hypothetical protein
MRSAPLRSFWRRFFDFVPSASAEEARLRVPFPAAVHFARRGQWVDVYVNPAIRIPAPPAHVAGIQTR